MPLSMQIHSYESGFTMAESTCSAAPVDLFSYKMRVEGIDTSVIELFSRYYRRITEGADGFMPEKELEPVMDDHVVPYESLDSYEMLGRSFWPRAVRIVLNGGLGTTMGLTAPKSLVTAKNGRTFMDIILSEAHRTNVALCLMNSFNTHEETCRHIGSRAPADPPLMFFQHRFPKILQENLMPAYSPEDSDLEWNPAGHGDVYNSLHVSGLLDKLLHQGIRYAFISNSDNLGATLDPALLGYFAIRKLPFMMEVAERTPSDAKGGHLAMKKDGTLVLRESAQCPPADRECFQDIERYRFFNTNNIWIDLTFLKRLIERDGFIDLPMILNPKPLDPRNEASPPVFQVETAMGAAISLFEGAMAVRVPRSRFVPVKSTNDLLVLRSDRFTLSPETGLTLSRGLEDKRIDVDLDPDYYKHLDRFEERFSKGVPALSACSSLTVRGNIYFEENVTIRGNVVISASGPEQHTVSAGAVIDSDMEL